ncbi:hypothetical protein PTT_17837 [Pyrenophora teres f. teres 0-1]|uniref:Uncharacterized protein n=1 Tax=Pyrenophora teres f. teres (strain 0-1) TaxID=861557 RepID=E3S5D5_PYRTT|nr:hypothetical protein PTT_17837 [Pyrenophora teres f. teres 0-1]
MAALAVVKIPKAISGPSGPSVPSFLTTLSPELRNNIYEYLFELHLLVLLHDEEAYRHFLIDAGRFGTGDRARSKDHDLLPALKHVWPILKAKCELTFARSGRFPQSAGVLRKSNALNIMRYVKYPQLISPVVIQEEEIEECEAIEGVVSSQDLSISLFDMDLTGGFKVNNRSRDVS